MSALAETKTTTTEETNPLMTKAIAMCAALEKKKEAILAVAAADDWYKNDEILSVKFSRPVLEYANPELQNDKEVVERAVMFDGYALKFASAGLQADKDVVSSAVKSFGGALEYASADLKNNKQVALFAANDPWAETFQHVSVALRNDKEVVMVAVASNGTALEYASEALKNDKEVVSAAFVQLEIIKSSDDFATLKEMLITNYVQIITKFERPAASLSDAMKNDKDVNELFNKMITNFGDY